MSVRALDPVRSVKVKLGLLVAASVTVASVIATIGSAGGVPIWLSIPVTIALALAVTQLLAVGMTSPLREMTVAADGWRRGTTPCGSRPPRATRSASWPGRSTGWPRSSPGSTGSAASWSPTSATSSARRWPRCAPCWRTSPTASPSPTPQTLRAALDQGERMTALVTDLLDLSRVDAGKAPLARETVEVRPLLEAAVAESRVGGRDVAYVAHVSRPTSSSRATPPACASWSPTCWTTPSRHSPPGGTVTIRAREADDDRWQLEVADEGPGVAPEHRDRAFERFGTLSDVAIGGPSSGGTGLGLAIARWVTDLHDGSIGFADPEPGDVRRPRPGRPPDHAGATPARPTHPRPGGRSPCPHPRSPPRDPRPRRPPSVPSLTDGLFGDFWPDRGVPGNVAVLLGALGVGVLAGVVLPFRNLGLGMFLVLLATTGVLLVASRHRRDRFTSVCAGLCLALACVVVVRDAVWIVLLCLLAGAVLGAVGLTRGRRVPAFLVALVAWPLAALRGLPWLGRTARAVTGLGNGAALLRTALWSLLGITVFALLFASADALFAEWVGAVVPDLGSAELAARAFVALAVGGVVLAGPTSPSTRRAPNAASAAPVRWRTGSSGWRRCWSSTPCSPCSSSRRPRRSSAATTTWSARRA